MKINEVSKRTNLTKKAINYYEEKGLISPDLDESGHRDFSEGDMEVLNKIGILRSLGLSLDEIKRVFEGRLEAEEVRKILLKKKLEEEVVKKAS